MKQEVMKPIIPNGKDLLIPSGEGIDVRPAQPDEKYVKDFTAKYAAFMPDADEPWTAKRYTELCFLINKGSFAQMFEVDYEIFQTRDRGALLDAVNIAYDTGNKVMEICHCYTPDGDGYFAVTGDRVKHFVPSMFPLQRQGGCWSYSVWRRDFFGQALLFTYLNELKKDIKSMLKITRTKLVFDIKPMYLPYINCPMLDDGLNAETAKSFGMSEEQIKLILESQKMFMDKYAKEYKESKEYASNRTWYNKEENESYYYAEEVIQEAIDKLYAKEKALKCDITLWDKTRRYIDILYDLKFKRGMFCGFDNR